MVRSGATLSIVFTCYPLGASLLDAPDEMEDDDSDGCSELIMTDEDKNDTFSLSLSGRVAQPQPSMVVSVG